MESRLTVPELIAISKLSEDTILREIKRGNLRATKVCGRWLIKQSHANLWLSYPEKRSGRMERAKRGRAGVALAGSMISTP